jgi:hypothetical protein
VVSPVYEERWFKGSTNEEVPSWVERLRDASDKAEGHRRFMTDAITATADLRPNLLYIMKA